MNVHGLAIIFFRHHVYWADLDDAGVVHQHVDGAEVALDARDHLGDVVRIRDVAGVSANASAAAAKIFFGALQCIGVASADGDASALTRELTREFQSQPTRAAGDQHQFVTKVHGAAGTQLARDQPTAKSQACDESELPLHGFNHFDALSFSRAVRGREYP